MPYKTWTLTIVTLFLNSAAAEEQDIRDFDPLFSATSTLEAEVEAPFRFLSRERPEKEQSDGKFRFIEANGTEVEFDVRIRARGNWRLDPDICRFPPMRFNFRKSQTDDTLFHKQDKLKVVTHCQDNRRYAQSVISEYLAYRIFNLLTDYSFRVRLVNMTYIYTDQSETHNSYAVFIEHKDRLGKRVDGKPVEIERTTVDAVHDRDLNLASVFQFMIGNTDFSPIATAPDEDCCHNQALFSSKEGPFRTIPYDFDQSGFVDARHAAPNPRFGLQNVRQRLYRGRCINNEVLPETLQLFRDKRLEIEALIENQAELSSTTRRKLLDYVSDFYDLINDPEDVEEKLVNRCLPS